MKVPGIKNLRWAFYRLRAMPVPEILFRLKFHFKKIRWKNNIPEYRIYPRFPENDLPPSNMDVDRVNNQDLQNLMNEADLLLEHRWFFFGLNGLQEEEINWHKDIESGKIAPSVFGFSVNHRDENLVGNIKITWEKNRHNHLTLISAAYRLSGQEKYATEVRKQIKGWIDQNPFLTGVNWNHPLESGIRLISWVYCESLLRGSIDHTKLFDRQSPFWKSVYEHQRFISESYSRGSSANNHLIGEMAGLYISTSAWPFFRESKTWKKLAKNILEREIIKQVYPSGINREMAFSYQIFVLEFLILCLTESKKNNDNFSDEFVIRVRSMLDAVYELCQGHLIPDYGDNDNGRAIQLGPSGKSRIDWLLETGNHLVKMKHSPGKLNNIESILLGAGTARHHDNPMDAEGNSIFKDAGLFFLAKQETGAGNVEVLFDAGPLGFGSMASHGHADALSFTLSVDNIPVFIDPGTYCYHTSLEKRKYFRGTSAHNTVVINGKDQSEQCGPFLWSRKAVSKIIETDTDDNSIKASHNGYANLGITHTRLIKLSQEFRITDRITGKGKARTDFRFHLHPDVTIKSAGPEIELEIENLAVTISNSLNIIPEILNGTDDGGWYSPSFNVIIPSNTLSYRKELSLPVEQIFLISVKKTRT